MFTSDAEDYLSSREHKDICFTMIYYVWGRMRHRLSNPRVLCTGKAEFLTAAPVTRYISSERSYCKLISSHIDHLLMKTLVYVHDC